MKRLRAVVMIVSAALLRAPVASADPGWGPYQCDGGGYCGNGTSTKPNGPLTQPGGPNSNLPGYQPPGWS
jgi:hypothetical protein